MYIQCFLEFMKTVMDFVSTFQWQVFYKEDECEAIVHIFAQIRSTSYKPAT